jgi:hypothetical protein
MSKLYDDLVAATCVPEPGRPIAASEQDAA